MEELVEVLSDEHLYQISTVEEQQFQSKSVPSTSFQVVNQINEILEMYYPDSFFVSTEEERSLLDVTGSKIYSRKKDTSTNKKFYSPDGLFSEQIFGPVTSFKCQCPVVKVNYGEVCPECGVEITSSTVRRKRYGKIPTIYVLSSQAAMLIKNVPYLSRVYDGIITRHMVFISKKGLDIKKVVKTTAVSEEEMRNLKETYNQEDYYHISVIYQLPEIVKRYYEEKGKGNEFVKILVDLIEKGRFFSDYILVIPPELRPLYIADDTGSMLLNDINSIYLKILMNLEKNIYKDQPGYDHYSLSLIGTSIEYYVNALRMKMLDELKSKDGIVRSTLGKRIDFSARGVIVPHNDRTDVVYVPTTALLEVLKLRIAGYLSFEKKIPVQFFITEIENVKNGIESQYKDDVLNTLDTILSTEYIRVIMNRQPTLHRGSMYAMRVKRWDTNAVGIPKTVCSSLNADFDGDTVALYFIFDKKFQHQVEKMEPQHNSINYQDLSYQLIPKQDIIYSMYKLTETRERREKMINSGLLDPKYKDTIVTSKQLSKILLEKNSVDYLDKLVSVSNIYTDHYPITLSPLDFIYDTNKNLLRNESSILTGNIQEDFKKLKEIEDDLSKRFILSDLILSGARGKFEQVRQITHARGYLTDFYGNLVETPITKSYIDKFTIEDLYNSTRGVRKSLYDQHGTISKSGYLYRKLSFSSISGVYDRSVKDCGTKHTLKVYVDSLQRANTLQHRYYYDEDPMIKPDSELKQVTDPSEIVGKVIYLRSPVTCSSHTGYCSTCYPLEIQTPYIGLVASQSISERLSQLSLRTFHTSGIATGVTDEKQKKAEDITNHLNYLLHHFDSSCNIGSVDELVDKIDEIQSILIKHGNIQQVHLELVTSERLFVFVTMDDKQYVVPYRRYVNDFERFSDKFQNVRIEMKSVKEVPHLKSQTLGLLFQKTRVAIGNLLRSILNEKPIKTTPLDKIVLFFTSF